MEAVEVRLEILKLLHRHDHAEKLIIARARAFEEYVLKSKDFEQNSLNSLKDSTDQHGARETKPSRSPYKSRDNL